MSDDLKIKISADEKDAIRGIDAISKKAEDLGPSLESAAKISAVAFAALTAEIGFSLKAFEEADSSSRKLTQALQSQGIFTTQLRDQYKSYAQAVEDATGVDGDALVAAQATAQAFLGQTKITQDLTAAIADLAQEKGIDLNSAATLLAKTIGTGTNALAREGLEISKTATTAERYAAVLSFVEGRYKGQAAAANQGLGSLKALQTQFGNLQEAIGQRFAPVATAIITTLTKLFSTISQNEALADLIVALISGAAAASGFVLAAVGVAKAIAVAQAAMAAFGVASNVALAGIPALIGVVVAAVTLLALNWETASGRIIAVVRGLGIFIGQTFEGIGRVLAGAFTLDTARIKSGIDEIKNAYKNGADVAFKDLPVKAKEAVDKQDEILKAAAEERARADAENKAQEIALAEAQNQLLQLKAQEASAALIAIKQQEIETLTAIRDAETQSEIAALQFRYDQLTALEEEQRIQDLERQTAFAEIEGQLRDSLQLSQSERTNIFYEQKRAALEASLLTEKEAEARVATEKVSVQIASQNRRLEETQRYGVAYAAINQAIQSREVQGFKGATGELVALTQSKNSTLKAIGKAASLAQITIKTAESALNIYAGFSTIPIVGPALGVAGAAAAIAFGVEQAGRVIAANEGGVITGGTPGRDSVSALLTPGELVSPAQNFEEVVGSVAFTRALRDNPEAASGFGSGGKLEIELTLRDELMNFIEAKLIEREKLGVSQIAQVTA